MVTDCLVDIFSYDCFHERLYKAYNKHDENTNSG